MKRVLLINDTSFGTNPGCKAAVAGIRLAYEARFGPTEWRSLPLGYWADAFSDMAGLPRDCVERRPGIFPRARMSAKPVDVRAWRERCLAQGARDRPLHELLDWCELVVVNGEGSIHHNLPRALALLGLIQQAGTSGRKVHLVNCTIFAMESAVVQEALRWPSFLHVRDESSQRTLHSLGLASERTSDLACLSFARLLSPEPKVEAAAQPATCLLTAGVGAYPAYLESLLLSVRTRFPQASYLSIGDGGERPLAEKLCQEANLSCIAVETLGEAELLQLLSTQSFVVSGRHHINLLVLLAGIPCVPLPSNTNKIEENLRELGYPLTPAGDPSELGLLIERVARETSAFRALASAAGRRALASAATFSALLAHAH